MLSPALISGNPWPLWKMKLLVRSKRSTSCLECQSNLTRVNQCHSAVTKYSLEAFIKIYQSPIGRCFQWNKNLHFTFEHLAADCVLSQILPGSICCKCDLTGAHPQRVLASHLKEPQTCWSLSLDSVGWGSHETISSFAEAAVFCTVPVCCAPLCSIGCRSGSCWGALCPGWCWSDIPLALCTPSNVPGSIPVSCMQILSADVNASLVFIAWWQQQPSILNTSTHTQLQQWLL